MEGRRRTGGEGGSLSRDLHGKFSEIKLEHRQVPKYPRKGFLSTGQPGGIPIDRDLFAGMRPTRRWIINPSSRAVAEPASSGKVQPDKLHRCPIGCERTHVSRPRHFVRRGGLPSTVDGDRFPFQVRSTVSDGSGRTAVKATTIPSINSRRTRVSFSSLLPTHVLGFHQSEDTLVAGQEFLSRGQCLRAEEPS